MFYREYHFMRINVKNFQDVNSEQFIWFVLIDH